MAEFVTNGVAWGVVRVRAGDPRLFDGTGVERLGTADPITRTISIRADLEPPMLDRVVLHEIAHAIAVSWGEVGTALDDERAAQMMERHAVEAVALAGEVLGRPVCIMGVCR